MLFYCNHDQETFAKDEDFVLLHILRDLNILNNALSSTFFTTFFSCLFIFFLIIGKIFLFKFSVKMHLYDAVWFQLRSVRG